MSKKTKIIEDSSSLNNLAELTKGLMSKKATEIAPNETKKTPLNAAEITGVINTLSVSHGLTAETAYTAIVILFLKGAANNGAPNTISVEVNDPVQGPVTITKYDLKYAYNRITNNEFIRRLAESLAHQIGKYAESNGLSGDIAQKINSRILSNKEEKDRVPLTQKESAWASSFSQGILNLGELSSSRLPQLLAADYYERFQKNSRNNTSGNRNNPGNRNNSANRNNSGNQSGQNNQNSSST